MIYKILKLLTHFKFPNLYIMGKSVKKFLWGAGNFFKHLIHNFLILEYFQLIRIFLYFFFFKKDQSYFRL